MELIIIYIAAVIIYLIYKIEKLVTRYDRVNNELEIAYKSVNICQMNKLK